MAPKYNKSYNSILDNDISQKSGIYESKWVENWLNSRKDILSQNKKVLDKFYDKYSEYPLRHLSDLSFSRDLKSDLEGQIKNLKNTAVYSSYKDLYPPSALSKYKALSKDESLSDNYMEALNNNENSAKVYSDSIYERFKTLGYRGFNSPNKEANTGGSIINLVEYNTPEYYSTNIHEFAHSLKAESQKAKIFDIIHGHSPFIRAQNNEDFYDENNKNKYNIDNYKKQIDLMLIHGKSHIYLDSPDEIYSRLMQFRHDNNLNPNKKYTNDDIELFRKNKNTKDNNFLNRYTNEYVLKFINDVAFNNQNKNNNNLA